MPQLILPCMNYERFLGEGGGQTMTKQENEVWRQAVKLLGLALSHKNSFLTSFDWNE